jgi:hypothetical protein
MPSVNGNRSLPLVGWGWLVVSTVGCGGRGGYERYVPPEPAARAALEAALTSWQNDAPLTGGAAGGPKVEFLDSHRPPGQKLRGFEVLGEVMAEGPRCFVVRLSLDNPRAEEKIRFCVLGVDPLWVMRQEELEMVAHWECWDYGGKGKDKEAPPTK